MAQSKPVCEGDCPKTKLKTKKNTIYSTEKTDKAPDIVCAADENRVFGQPGGGNSPFAHYYMTRNRLNYLKRYRKYFSFSAYWFSLFSRHLRMVSHKESDIKKAFYDAIRDHKRGLSGKMY